MANKQLYTIKKKQKDEFYTHLSDMEDDLRHCREHSRGMCYTKSTIDYIHCM
jgi:hypothetical protein